MNPCVSAHPAFCVQADFRSWCPAHAQNGTRCARGEPPSLLAASRRRALTDVRTVMRPARRDNTRTPLTEHQRVGWAMQLRDRRSECRHAERSADRILHPRERVDTYVHAHRICEVVGTLGLLERERAPIESRHPQERARKHVLQISNFKLHTNAIPSDSITRKRNTVNAFRRLSVGSATSAPPQRPGSMQRRGRW